MTPALRLRALPLLVLCLLCPSVVTAQIVTGSGPGSNATVRVIDTDGTDRSFLAYPVGFGGGTTVALGDINGDGVRDIITGAGPSGGPHVRVWNGVDLTEIGGFFAYSPFFAGGVSVAAGDVNGDGRVDIITGAGPGGGPHVRVWSGVDFTEIGGFFAYDPAFPGGVSVAAGDVDGDGRADIITGAGPGGGPHVRVWSGADFHEIGGFFAYSPFFAGGVHVAAGDVNGDGLADIITGAGPGGGPHVRLWNGATFAEFGGFFAYDPSFPGGVKVAALDLTYDGRVEILTVPGPGAGPLVAIWTSDDFSLMGAYFAFDPAFTGGMSIASPPGSSAVRFTSATATTFSATTPGTFTVTTVGGGAVPTLTVTGALPTGVTFTDNGDRTATLAGTPAAATGGSYPLTFTATSGSAAPVTQSFALTISQAPAITSAAATTFGLGGPGTFTVTTTGFPAPTLSSTGVLPVGVTFTPNADGTATLAGTPAPGSGGAYPLTITAANGVSPDAVQAFVLTVNSSPAFTSANATTFTVGAAGTFAITTIATPPVTSITRTGTLPGGVTFTDNGNGTATLAGTPAAATGGTYVLTLTAANGVGTNAVQTFTLTVRQAPVITSAAATTFVVGAAGTFTVTTSGFPTSALTLSGALPSGVLFTDNLDGTATLAGTPGAGTGGSYPVSITAANGVGSNAVQSFTLTVNQAPAITSANTATFLLNTAGTTFQVVMTGVPTPTVSVTSGVLPTGLTLSSAGLLSGTPTQSGSFPVTLTATNGTLPNATHSFTVVVNAPPAITSANNTTFTVGSAGSFTVVMTGFPAPTVSVTTGTLPAGVTLTPAGVLSGTPDPGTGGVHTVTLTATNGIGANATQSFTLTVNQAPAITSANAATFLLNTAGTTFQVVMTGFPAPTVSVTTGVLPTGVTLSAAGLLSGTPTQSGSFPVTLTATNGTLPNATQAFTIAVNAPPAITSANNDTFIVGTADSFTVTTTGTPTPTVTHTGTLPTGVTFTTNVLGGTATQTGAFPLVFTAANGVGADAVQAFTLNVVCPAITVTALSLPDGLYLTVYGAVDFNQSGSTGSGFTWGATGLPAGITIDANTGVVSGTPTNTQVATAVAITVTDNFGCTGVRNTSLIVRPSTDNENYLGGVGHTQYVVSGAVPTTPHVFVADNVKVGDNGPGALSVVFGPATNGTVSEGPTDGTFTYTPNVNFAGPTDSFGYTLTDGNGVTNTATVTINLSGRVWYVNSSGGNGDGRSHLPFNSVTNAQAPSSNGDVIFVHTGGATTPGSITLKASQSLVGQGAAFTLNALTIAGGANPVLTGSVTLANNVFVGRLTINSSDVTAITGSSLTGIETIDQVTILGATGTSVNLINNGGTINFTNSSISGAPGIEFRVSGGNATMNVGATITNTVGPGVDVQNRTGGSMTFSGPITDSAWGIGLANNGTSTIAFTGGMALGTSGPNGGFTAINSGTVTVTGTNTIATTTGTALNVTNTTIGAGGLTFRSIASNGAVNGIVLNTSGAGGLTVTGTGAADSGGSIVNSSGDGITLTSTGPVALSQMNITSSGQSHIDATTVNGLSLTNVDTDLSTQAGIQGANVTNLTISGGTFDRGGLANTICNINGLNFINLLGTSTVTGATFRRSNTIQFRVNNDTATNFAGTPDTLTVTGTNWSNHNQPVSGGTLCFGDHLSVNSDTGGNFRLIVNSSAGINTVNATNDANGGGIGVQATAGGTNGKMDASVTGLKTSNNTAGVVIGNTGTGSTVTYNIFGNKTANGTGFSGTGSLAIAVTHVSSGATTSGIIDDNSVTHTAGPGTNALQIILEGGGTLTTRVSNNNVSGNFQRGFEGASRLGTGTLNLTLNNNTLNGTDTTGTALQAVNLSTGGSGTGHGNSMCLNMSNNNVTFGPGATYTAAYRLVNDGTSSCTIQGCSFSLQNFVGSGSNATDIQNWVTATKSNATGGNIVSVSLTPPTSAAFQASVGSCQIP